MSREWKPGEAAIIRCGELDCERDEHPAIFGRSKEWWLLDKGEYLTSHDALPVRPLVVIDPEDRQQVERLASLVLPCKSGSRCVRPDCEGDRYQAALREFADPKPPKPEEPTGLGAVVEDADGELWVQFSSKNGMWWRSHIGRNARWHDIAAVRILSEGVTTP